MDKIEQLKEMMKVSGAHLEGHFRLSSGLHSGNYMQCARLLAIPEYAAFAGELLADKLRGLKPDFVTAPAIGGLIIGHEVARALNIPFLFCERDDKREMKIRRFEFPLNSSAIVVEDVITTGGSTMEVGKVLQDNGVVWSGTGVIVNRSGGKHVLPHQPASLWDVNFEVWQPESCPLCAKEMPIVKPGSK
ncbi:MAG: orotate phosphoribosyltransferase [Synergistaceae bacterium]|nr:orotate phosphoribosyltransferase [Synergistaceae bacterium]